MPVRAVGRKPRLHDQWQVGCRGRRGVGPVLSLAPLPITVALGAGLLTIALSGAPPGTLSLVPGGVAPMIPLLVLTTALALEVGLALPHYQGQLTIKGRLEGSVRMTIRVPIQRMGIHEPAKTTYLLSRVLFKEFYKIPRVFGFGGCRELAQTTGRI